MSCSVCPKMMERYLWWCMPQQHPDPEEVWADWVRARVLALQMEAVIFCPTDVQAGEAAAA